MVTAERLLRIRFSMGTLLLSLAIAGFAFSVLYYVFVRDLHFPLRSLEIANCTQAWMVRRGLRSWPSHQMGKRW